MIRRLAFAFALVLAATVSADTSTYRLLQHAWPGAQAKKTS